MSTDSTSVRSPWEVLAELARQPEEEVPRAARMNRILAVSGHALLLLVLAAGVRLELWESHGEFARLWMVRDDRTIRRWIAGDGMPEVVVDRLVELAALLQVDPKRDLPLLERPPFEGPSVRELRS